MQFLSSLLSQWTVIGKTGSPASLTSALDTLWSKVEWEPGYGQWGPPAHLVGSFYNDQSSRVHRVLWFIQSRVNIYTHGYIHICMGWSTVILYTLYLNNKCPMSASINKENNTSGNHLFWSNSYIITGIHVHVLYMYMDIHMWNNYVYFAHWCSCTSSISLNAYSVLIVHVTQIAWP